MCCVCVVVVVVVVGDVVHACERACAVLRQTFEGMPGLAVRCACGACGQWLDSDKVQDCV